MTHRLSALVLFAALATAGCDDLRGVTKGLARELKIPIVLHAADSDDCLYEQLIALRAEYRKLPRAERARFGERLRARYQRLRLEPTRFPQTVTGSSIALWLIVPTGYSPGNPPRTAIQPYIVATKTLEDHRTFTGPEPVTGLDRQDELTLTAEAARDESRTEVYATIQRTYYDSVNATGDKVFLQLRREHKIELYGEVFEPRALCGKQAALADLLPGY